LEKIAAQYPNALEIGTTLMEYRLEAVLGVGGFGITYLARDTLLEKDVAIKEFFPSGVVSRGTTGTVTLSGPNVADDYQTGLDRFLKEARTLAGFSHPNIVRVARYFKANDTGYMVMDYEHGVSLKAWLKEHPQPDEATMLGFIDPLLEGIEKVHRTGFLHRDIKPDNIFIREHGDPVLIDFGSARQAVANATQTLTAMVTPGYAPFEQYSGESEQGPWTDIYALGAVLFFAMTGRNPPDAIARMKEDRLPRDLEEIEPRYGPRLVKAVRTAMEKDERQRPQSVTEWRVLLLPAGWQRSAPGGASGDSRTQKVGVPAEQEGSPLTRDMHQLLEQREQLERKVKEKYQRVLTVMFTDLKGSTALAESHGDIAVRGMLKRYHDLVTGAVQKNGGTLVKTIGDGSLSHFEGAQQAVRAATAIQLGMDEINLSGSYKTVLLARVGMHTGECLLEKNDVFGDVVNTAARFEGSAHPGEIFISEETFNALADKSEFYVRFDREVTLKGKSTPFNGYTVFWDPREAEKDRTQPKEAAPVARKTPVWKIALYVGVPLLVVFVLAVWITQGESFRGESRRSILHELPEPPSK
jgi:serine/threonine protein kinase